MSTDLELPEFEPEDNLGLSIEMIKVELAEAYLNRDFSDDNASLINRLTSFQQAIKFYFQELPIYGDFNDVYREIITIAQKMYQGEYEEYDEEGTDDEIQMEADGDDEDVQPFCNKMAKYIMAGIVTDDVQGIFSGRTALEELITYELGYVGEEEIENIKNEIAKKILSNKGGYDCSAIERLIFRKTD